VPVITGPYTDNSREIARSLLQRGGAVEVEDAEMLAEALRRFFAEPTLRERMGQRAREFVEAHRGSVAQIVELIAPLLEVPPRA